MKWIDIKGGVVADTVYADGVLVAKDVSFTLPGISIQTADVQAMGTMSLALVGLIDHMELSITKVGVDLGLRRMCRLEKQNLEFRWVQEVLDAEGATSHEGCKAFVRTLPAQVPDLGVEVGSATEGETTYGVTRQQVFCGGEEIMCIDRLSQILRIDGKDYMTAINNLL